MEYNDVELGAPGGGKERGDDLTDSESEDSGKSLLWNDVYPKDSLQVPYSKKMPSLRFHIWATAFNILLFLISSFLVWISLRVNNITLQDHWRATTFYSPIYDRFDIPKITRVTNGTLYDTNPPSIWRQRVGKEADDAWDRVGSNAPPIIVDKAAILALGKDPQTAVRLPESYGYGSEAYLGSVESFHHIHCLDKLRKEISYGHYWEKEEGPAPGRALHEAHTSHCIDVLIQSLMCTGSVDMITYNWVEGRDMMMPDFNNNKVCRDFEAILGWVNDIGVHFNESQIRALTPPADAVRVPNELHPPH